MDVEAVVLGEFTNAGKFHVRYGKRTVTFIDIDFLHNGVPRMELKAKWKSRLFEEPQFEESNDLNKTLEEILSRLNICSKEYKLRQYDHEVKGLSVIKPLVGDENDSPSDACISLLEYGSREGLIFAEGINPNYSDIDTYHMAASVIDEAIRRIIAVGGELPTRDNLFYGLDNFCWNISTLKNEDGEFKLAQLVRANKALSEYCLAFGIPCISGKDSMKNVWKVRETDEGKEVEKVISIPPTLMFSTRAKIKDVGKAVTMEVKSPGDLLYVIGETFDETGGSEYYHFIGERLTGQGYIGNKVPKVNSERAKEIYSKMSKATEKELINSIHTPTLGGLGIAFALTALAGGYGLNIDLKKVPCLGVDRNDILLFSESNSRFVVTVSKERKREFERLMDGVKFAEVGVVTRQPYLKIKGFDGKYAINADIRKLKKVWKNVLKGV
jgi:phosphoribosylformylglycinamidine synthase